MREKGMGVLVVLAAFLASQGILFGDGHYKVLNGPANFYYGHISFVETKAGGQAPEVRREGRPLPEVAVVNVPLGPGDTVRTSGDSRCEIQFDTATVIRLDFDTELAGRPQPPSPRPLELPTTPPPVASPAILRLARAVLAALLAAR